MVEALRHQNPAHEFSVPESPEPAARAYWLARAHRLDGPRAVHPDSRWLAYDTWTRGLLQRWTLARIRADRPRYRRCADLGCGFGDWTRLFAQVADEVHACDLAPEFVDQARARVVGHPMARIACADVRAYAIPRGVDLVYVGAVLMYLPDRDVLDVLSRIRAAAAPGALVIVREFCAFNLGQRQVESRDGGYTVYRRASELRATVERVGLRVLEQRCSPSMYGEVLASSAPALAWPLRAIGRMATLGWRRASHTLVTRA